MTVWFTHRVTVRSYSIFISRAIISRIGTQRSYLQLLLCLKNGFHAQKTKVWAHRTQKHLPALICNVPPPDMLMKGAQEKDELFILHFERYTCGKCVKLLKWFNSFSEHTKRGGNMKKNHEVLFKTFRFKREFIVVRLKNVNHLWVEIHTSF